VKVALGAALLWLTLAVPPALAGEAKRIVSLAPSVTEILFALGAGDRIVGVSSYCDYPPEAARIDRIGTFLAPNVELILAKRPDLVVGVPTPGNRSPVESLSALGLRVVVVDPERVEQILASIRTVAGAVGADRAGEELARSIVSRMQAVDARLRGVPRRRVLMVLQHVPLIAAGKGTYQDELIERAGGFNVAAASGERWPHLTLEFVLAQAPEVIIDTTMDNEDGSRTYAEFWNALPTLPAVRDGRIRQGRADQLLRPGPRAPESLETFARFIHPERFAPNAAGAP